MNPASRLPILLSACACPGLGQFVQGRWKAGRVLLSGFLVGFCWVMVLAVGNIVAYYSLIAKPDADPEVTQPKAFILPLMVVGLFYFGSLADVFRAHLRIGAQQREEELLKQHETTDP